MQQWGGNYSFPGFDLIGSTAVLRVNKYGERYSNEGYGTQILAATTGARQPNGMLWGIFDSEIFKQLEYQAPCHAVFDYSDMQRVAKLETALSKARANMGKGIITSERRPLYCANTLPQLATLMFDNKQSCKSFW